MTEVLQDTIAAIATPSGAGGVGIVRISGEKSFEIAKKITAQNLKPRTALYCDFKGKDKGLIDQGIAIYFKSPNSYTGEDVVELQGHGGVYVLQNVLEAVLSLGARIATPGEFTQRAFLNNKIDLLQAESISDLISANSKTAANAALKSLSGVFSDKINILLSDIIQVRAFVEASLDFSDEEIDFLSDGKIQKKLDGISNLVDEILEAAKKGKVLQEGLHIVIVGKTNAGKSSLLNQLLGDNRAIVTSQEGTTRDTLEEQMLINDIAVTITDTAGIRETKDLVEKEGIKRTKKAMKKADIIIWLRDISKLDDERPKEIKSEKVRFIEVHNKSDLVEKTDNSIIKISAKTGFGIDDLIEEISSIISVKHNEENIFSARKRHLIALELVRKHINLAKNNLLSLDTSELVAEELRICQLELSKITGEYLADDLLGEIFSSFCIGK